MITDASEDVFLQQEMDAFRARVGRRFAAMQTERDELRAELQTARVQVQAARDYADDQTTDLTAENQKLKTIILQLEAQVAEKPTGMNVDLNPEWIDTLIHRIVDGVTDGVCARAPTFSIQIDSIRAMAKVIVESLLSGGVVRTRRELTSE